MPARVEIDELNTVGIATHGVVNLNVGDIDAPNIVVGPLTAIKRGQDAFIKYHRVHFIDLGGADSVSNIRIWVSSGDLLPEIIQTNLGEGNAYNHIANPDVPVRSPRYNANNMPTVQPLTENLRIGGELNGVITDTLGANRLSDIWKWQLQVGAAVPPGALKTKRFSFAWEEK